MTITALEPARPVTLADRAYLGLRDRLITLQIRPGEPIDDAQVAAELGVGRTPVREALKRLEDDRLVIAYPRRGTFATTVDIADLAHLNDIRLQLEPLAARRAAERSTEADRTELRELVDQILAVQGRPVDRLQLMELDLAVHRAIYRTASNPHLEDVLIRCHGLSTRIFCLLLDRLADVPAHVHEHAALLEAIIAGDSDQAEALARQHVAGFERGVRAVV